MTKPSNFTTLIMKTISAGDPWCLSSCWARNFITLPQSDRSLGGLAFSVTLIPNQEHMIHILLTHMGKYDVCRTRLAKNGKIITEEEATCQRAELMAVVYKMCNK